MVISFCRTDLKFFFIKEKTKNRYEGLIPKYLLWISHDNSIDKWDDIYICVLVRRSSNVELHGWPSTSPDLACIIILCSCKLFSFQRKVERKFEIPRIIKEAATRLLTQFSVNVKHNICSCKNYLSNINWWRHANKIWRRLIK